MGCGTPAVEFQNFDGAIGLPQLSHLSNVMKRTQQNFDDRSAFARVALPEVCDLFGISPATVWRRVKQGLIPAPIKEGGTTRWLVGDLRRALAK